MKSKMIIIISLSLFISSFVKAQNLSDEILNAMVTDYREIEDRRKVTEDIINDNNVASIIVRSESGEFCEISSHKEDYTPDFLDVVSSKQPLFHLKKCGVEELEIAEITAQTAGLQNGPSGVQVAVAPVLAGAVVATGCGLGIWSGIELSKGSTFRRFRSTRIFGDFMTVLGGTLITVMGMGFAATEIRFNNLFFPTKKFKLFKLSNFLKNSPISGFSTAVTGVGTAILCGNVAYILGTEKRVKSKRK